jgi:hypothetical protein
MELVSTVSAWLWWGLMLMLRVLRCLAVLWLWFMLIALFHPAPVLVVPLPRLWK